MNEEEFIDTIRRREAPLHHPLILGMGDDAAVFKPSFQHLGLFATDMLCERVHFLADEDPRLIGRKALAVNLSDIAAMGARPTLAVLALAFPESRGARYGLEIVAGVQALAEEFGVSLCGGDTNRSENGVSVCVSILGEAQGKGPLLRSGAKEGDSILVTGSLGGTFSSRKHLLFKPRVEEAIYLNTHYFVHAMADISDGLVRDLSNILKESSCGAILDPEAIPVSSELKHLSQQEQVKHAMTDGEDFELVFTMSSKEAEKLLRGSPFPDCSLRCVGKIVKEPGLFWTSGEAISYKGYTHTFA